MSLKRTQLKIGDAASTVALCGGPYSNFAALEAFLNETNGTEFRFCLGDIGGFGPEPNRTFDLIRASNLICIQGNYDHAIAFDQRDCGCGYVNADDRYYAQVSYDYTAQHTSVEHKRWLRTLPEQIELQWCDQRILLCHGSPDRTNEFVWESETADATIEHWLQRYQVHGIVCTHSGIPWLRKTAQGFWFNVGVLGRPAHENARRVYYGAIERHGNDLVPRLISLEYDPTPVMTAMKAAGLPQAFVDSLASGLWKTCYNILPAAERLPRDRLSSTLECVYARDPASAESE